MKSSDTPFGAKFDRIHTPTTAAERGRGGEYSGREIHDAVASQSDINTEKEEKDKEESGNEGEDGRNDIET